MLNLVARLMRIQVVVTSYHQYVTLGELVLIHSIKTAHLYGRSVYSWS